MGNQRYKLRIGAHWRRALFVEDLVFVHWPTVDFSSGRSARRENNLLPSNLLILVTTTIITGTLKGRQRGRIQHPRFREAPRQISSSFVLPFARCQLMNSVCLGRRADKYTDTHAHVSQNSPLHKSHISILGSLCSLFLPGRRPSGDVGAAGKGRKNEEHAEEQSNSGQCSRRQTDLTDEAISTFLADCY